MDYSPPGSSVHGISQARILEWVAISSSRGSSRARDQSPVSWSPVSPALQVDSLPLSPWGQRVVVSPVSTEGNSCCATNIRTHNTFLSVLLGLLEVLVIWPALSDHCTLPTGTSEKKEDFGFDWERLLNITNGGREDNHPVTKRHGGDKHIKPRPGSNKSDSRRVVIYLTLLDSPTSSVFLWSEQTLRTPVFYSALEVPQLFQGPYQSTVHTAGNYLFSSCLPLEC